MPHWPTQIEYQDALKIPKVCFADFRFRSAAFVNYLPFGLPQPISGHFANVYRMRAVDGGEWAIRLFLSPSEDRGRRYAALAEHLRTLEGRRPSALVDFEYQPHGIRVGDTDYPLLAMPWVEGPSLERFVETHLYNTERLMRLALAWRRVVGELHDTRIAHGDLQHGNILIEEGVVDGAEDRIRLIDYDGVWVPALGGEASLEIGHPAYQHPKRTVKDFGPDLDRFSALAIYASLRVLAVDPSLWYRLNNGDNLLFKGGDFRGASQQSALQIIEPALRSHLDEADLIRSLKLAAQGPIWLVPALVR